MNTASQRILIVDQDEGMGSKLKLFLRSREHIAEACTNVEDARRFLDHFSCDIVMVDVDLPESGALELCYSLRNLSDPIRLVLLVSPKSETGALKLFAADEQLMKPFIGRQVLMLLENLARRPAPKPPASSSIRPHRQAAPIPSASAQPQHAPSAVPVASRLLKQPPRAPQDPQAPQASQAPRAPQAPPAPQAPRAPLPPQAAPPSPTSRAAMLGIRGAGIVSSGAQPIRAARKVPDLAPPPQPVREEGEEGNISSLGPSHRNDASRPPGDSRAPFNPDASRPPAAQAVPAMRLPGRPPAASERPAAVDVQKAVEASANRPKPGRPQAMMTVMQSAGTLKDTPFPALLYKLFANQSTGTLTIQAGSTRTLYFLKGEPVHAVSSSASDSLGAILVNLGYLQMESLNQVLDDLPVNKPLGQELLARHLITHEALLEALDRQVYDRVINNFGLVSGTYMFVEGDDWLAEVRRFPQNPIALISDGVERFVGPNVLAEQLQAHLSKYVVKTEKFDFFREHFPSLERHEGVLRLLNGQRTLQQISAEVGGDLMSTLRLIWSLRLADMIDFSAQPRSDAQRSPEKPPLPRRLPTTSGANIPLMRPPAPAPSHKEDPQEKERKRLGGVVMGYYMRLGQQDHWQLLGVDRDADVTQVRERFLGILDEMPPEKLHLLGDSMREKAEEVHEALKLAYNTITEPKSLKTYMVKVEMRRRTQERAQLQRALPQPEAEPSRTVDLWEQADAERPSAVPVFMPGGHHDDEIGQNRTLRAFQVARKAVEEGRWKEAFHAAKTAAQFDPNNSEVTVLMAWIVYNLPHDDKSRQYKVCRQRIENELALNNAIPDAYLYLGRMEEDQRELRQALEHYRMALGLDPKHPAARKAIERLQRHPMLAKAEAAPAHEDANLLHRLKGFFGR